MVELVKTVGAIKAFGDYFKFDYGDLDYLLELNLENFKTGRWISKTHANVGKGLSDLRICVIGLIFITKKMMVYVC